MAKSSFDATPEDAYTDPGIIAPLMLLTVVALGVGGWSVYAALSSGDISRAAIHGGYTLIAIVALMAASNVIRYLAKIEFNTRK
ncbi:MAG: hypothetical protein LBV44_08620 [Methylobacillus sp.]|jgi:hypothetical protein|nr:hypothetical protein [Methylobacillus sp.]